MSATEQDPLEPDQFPRGFRSYRETERLTTIPSSWLEGFGRRQNGIEHILWSEKILSLGDGGMHLMWGRFGNWVFARQTKPGEITQEEIQDQPWERFMLTVVGFSSLELREVINTAADQYRGKTEAPFKVTLI
jgi:hypothetical protein